MKIGRDYIAFLAAAFCTMNLNHIIKKGLKASIGPIFFNPIQTGGEGSFEAPFNCLKLHNFKTVEDTITIYGGSKACKSINFKAFLVFSQQPAQVYNAGKLIENVF